MMGGVFFYQVHYVSDTTPIGRRRRSLSETPDCRDEPSWTGKSIVFHDLAQNRTYSIYQTTVRDAYSDTIELEGELYETDQTVTKVVVPTNPPGNTTTKCNHDPFHLEPEIRLDPDHFLIPILEWGPNNQLRGFMESMYIAIQLNRTLIVPPFFKHRTDTTILSHETQDALHPNKRIDPYLVSKYLSSYEDYDMKRLCGGKVNAVFKARQECNEYTVRRIDHFLRYTEMEPFYDESCSPIDPDLKVAPANQTHPSVPIDREGIRNLYGNHEARCAILLFPFMSVAGFESKLYAANRRYPSLSQEEEYIYNIIKHVQRPDNQRQFVQQFISNEMKGKRYIAIHWRFDKDDWQIHCARKEANYYCDTVKSIYSDLNTTKIAFKKYLEKVKRESDVQAVYFAAPLEENVIRPVVREVINPLPVALPVSSK